MSSVTEPVARASRVAEVARGAEASRAPWNGSMRSRAARAIRRNFFSASATCCSARRIRLGTVGTGGSIFPPWKNQRASIRLDQDAPAGSARRQGRQRRGGHPGAADARRAAAQRRRTAGGRDFSGTARAAAPDASPRPVTGLPASSSGATASAAPAAAEGPAPAAQHALAPGDLLRGRYLIQGLLGQAGWGSFMPRSISIAWIDPATTKRWRSGPPHRGDQTAAVVRRTAPRIPASAVPVASEHRACS